jgi:antitoxin (DNA-binding transcriptional repressor) of toxin-antitoxin stability system
MHVNAKVLRANLGYYLDCTVQGEDVFIIRNSIIVAKLVPVGTQTSLVGAHQTAQPDSNDVQLADGRAVEFREMGPYEDPDVLRTLYNNESSARDHGHPASYCQAFGGEFWLAVVEGVVIGCGGFYVDLTAVSGAHVARIHRVHKAVIPDSTVITEHLLAILFERATVRGLRLSK